jgi:hypothetical protein
MLKKRLYQKSGKRLREHIRPPANKNESKQKIFSYLFLKLECQKSVKIARKRRFFQIRVLKKIRQTFGINRAYRIHPDPKPF